jgi:hypothetical protein
MVCDSRHSQPTPSRFTPAMPMAGMVSLPANGETEMTTLNMEKTKTNAEERELTIDELDSAVGGCPAWLGAVAGGIAIAAWIRSLF